MAVSVVDSASTHGFLGTNPVATLSGGTPAAGDFVVVSIGTDSAALLTGISGLGATWTIHYANSDSWQSFAFAVGEGATSDGAITGTMNATRVGIMRAYVVRGLPAGTTWSAGAARNTSGSTLSGPSSSVEDGDFVLECAVVSDATLGNWTSWSGTGYTFGTAVAATFVAANTGYLLPTSSVTAQTSVAMSTTPPKGIAQLVGTAPAATGATLALAATAPLPTASFAVSVTNLAALNAVAPLPVVSITVDSGASSTVTGELDATAPAPVASFDVFVGSIDGQETYPTRAAIRLGYLTIPPAALPPAGVDPRPILRYSHVAPALSSSNRTMTEGVDYAAVTPVNEGTLHVFVDGVDVTYLGGVPIQAVQFSKVGPLGDVAASFELPGMQAWDKPGVGEFAAIDPSTDAPVEAVIIDDEGNRTHLFKGFLSADRAQVGESKRNGFTAEGVLWQAGHTIHEPPHYLPPTDIGTVIPRLLNSVPSRRYNDVPEVVTGLMTRHRGAGNQYVDQVILDILAKDGWTDDGQQWTLEQVGPDDFRMVLKPATDGTYDDTVTYGAFGIDVSLSREQTSRADVIYGRGVTAAGGQWRGTRFPGLILANPLPYPNADASSLHLGDTDADTDSGTGISDWQRRMNELGYGLRVDGTLNSNDIEVVRRLQRSMGLLVDGVIGPQTWAGSFNRGPEGIDLTQWREPIAWEPWTQPYLRDPNGVILSDNPDYDSTRIPHQIEVDFGAPITWREAQPPSRRMLAVESTAGLTGTIRMRTDFHNSWRGLAKPGMRVRVLGFQGESPVVRVAAVDAGVDADGFYVDLTVDERARDALSVDQILERNRAAMADPARRPGNPNRDSRNERDRFVQWDVDSPCGFMPRTAVFGGLWVAPNPIPFSEVGRIVRIVMSSTVPFVMGIFGLPTKPSQMAPLGNPLASSDPWRPHTDYLESLGWIDGWGSEGQRMGFYPGDEGSDYPFTGKTDLRGAWDYISGYPPYVWPLFYSATTGFIGGGSGDWVSRFYPATGD